MRSAVAKLNNGKIGSLVYHSSFRARLLQTILVTLVTLALCYTFLIGSIIWNIVERKALEGEARELSSVVGELELQYLSSYQNFDSTLSSELGFVETEPTFTTRTKVGAELGEVAKFVKNEI